MSEPTLGAIGAPYIVVDGAVGRWLDQMVPEGLVWHRVVLSSGACYYEQHTRSGDKIVHLEILAHTSARTVLAVTFATTESTIPPIDYLRAFFTWFESYQRTLDAVEMLTLLPDADAAIEGLSRRRPGRRGGRHTYEEDLRAQREYARYGEPERERIFKEWRLSLTDGRKIKNLRDTFRKAISPRKQSNPEE